MNKKTWLVTGGAGFIGANFVHQARGQDWARIVTLDKLTYAGNRDSLAVLDKDDDHIFVIGDIGDSALLAKLLTLHNPSAIVNFAAESHVDRSIDGPAAFVQTNVVGTLALLESTLAYWKSLPDAERATFRFLHISTDEVYGSLSATDAPFRETTAYAPNSPYAASKAASDHLVRAFHHTYGLPTLTTNCSNNYGPYQFPEKLIPLMIIKALQENPLPVYGDGQNIRDWLFVIDHVEAVKAVLQRGRVGETYNIGGQSEMRNIDLVNLLCDNLDAVLPRKSAQSYKQLITFVKDRPGHDRRYAVDISKTQREIGWKPRFKFDHGMNHTISWYLQEKSWWERILNGKYRGDRLGHG